MINTTGFQYQFDEFNTLALRLTHVHAEVFYCVEFLVKERDLQVLLFNGLFLNR